MSGGSDQLHRVQRRLAGASLLAIGLGFLLIFQPAGAAPVQVADLTPTPLYNPSATPPTQGGHGADVFYVYCMPCHGDTGQGLTDEFRLRQYPPEDTNCWLSGCHGPKPYDNGFTLPKTVPALIGPNTLTKFKTAQDLYGFISRAMPFNQPGSLSQEQYLYLTAFLLERNRLMPVGGALSLNTLAGIALPGSAAPSPDQATTPGAAAAPVATSDNSGLYLGLAAFLVIAVILSIITRPRRRPG